MIRIIAVGRMKDKRLAALADDFLKRIRPMAPVEVLEIKDSQPDKEGREMVARLGSAAGAGMTIALDERGRQFSSEEFAGQLRKWQESGHRTLAFAIGGADGLDRAVTDRATLLLALGRMTWPHMMARCMLVEQLYRAQQIQAGHPYHKG